MGKGRKRYRWEISMYGRQSLADPYDAGDGDRVGTGTYQELSSDKGQHLYDTSQIESHNLQDSTHSEDEIASDRNEDEMLKLELEVEDDLHEDMLATDILMDDESLDRSVPQMGYPDSLQSPARSTHIDHSREGEEHRDAFENESNSTINGNFSSDIESFGNIGTRCSSEKDFSDEAKSAKQREYERLAAFLYNAELSNVSQRATERLLKVTPISSPHSYRSLISHAVRTSQIEKSHVGMCIAGHVAFAGRLRSARQCPTCNHSIAKSTQKFWFMKPSSALKAICSARESFEAMMKGCMRAKESLANDRSETNEHDYYHGEMFLRYHSERIENWNPEANELYIFLTLSSDGFECNKNRRGTAISTWPILSTILNYTPGERSHASNCLIHAIVPSTHDSEYFDTFLSEIVADLKQLEKGVSTLCHDGRIRKRRAFVLFFTADWPAATKVLGYVGHTGRIFCRFCMKEKVFVKDCKCLCALPEDRHLLLRSLRERGMYKEGSIIDLECAPKREAVSVRSSWRSLGSKNSDEETRRQIRRKHGIKSNSCLSLLSMDPVFSFPYDVMHQVLLGWAKHLLKLVTGSHPRHERLSQLPRYCIPETILSKINRALDGCARGIPSSWGRPPLSLENLSRFKAEDMKRHSELYLLPAFHRFRVSKDLLHLWNQTRQMVILSFTYNCDEASVRCLTRAVEECYARFVRLFCIDRYSSYCLTPTTHTILHLPELLKQCGPLPITSQFLIERLLGEIGKRVQQTSNVASHLFHKNFRLLSLKLANEGKTFMGEIGDTLSTPVTKGSGFSRSKKSEEYNTGAICQGPGTMYPKLNNEQQRSVRKFVRENFPTQSEPVLVVSSKEFKAALIETAFESFKIESIKSHNARASGSPLEARQKYCIAAHFAQDNSSPSACSAHTGSVGSKNNISHLYYGVVERIYEFVLRVGRMEISSVFVDVKWQLNLVEDQCFELVYTDTKRYEQKTTEHSSCIQRVVGFLDLENRRYYLDPQRCKVQNAGNAILQGVMKRI